MKKIYFTLFLIFLSLFLTITTYCQDKNIVDSLTLLIVHGEEDILKAKHINDLVWYIKFSDPDTCLLLLNESEALSKKLDFADGLGNSYNNRAIIYTVSGNFIKALKYYNLATEQFSRNNDQEGVGFCLSNMAICFEYQSLFDSALVYNNKALAVREKFNLEKGIAQSNINIGVIYFNKGYYKLSLKHYLAALYFYENKQDKTVIDKSYIGSVQNNIGNIYLELMNAEMADQYLNDAFVTYENIGDKREMGYLYNDFGNLYHLTENYNLANQYYNKALNLSTESNEISMEVAALLGISTNYFSQHMLDSALLFANKGIESVKNISNDKYTIGLYLNIGNIYLEKKNWIKAIVNYQHVIEISEKTGIIKQTDKALYSIADCYIKIDNIYEANKYLRQYIIITDSILNREKYKQITEMEAIYENDKKTLLLEIKEADNRELQSKNRIQYLIIISVTVLIFILLLLFLYRRQLQKTKLIRIKQENEILIQKAQAKIQKAERKRLANMLHDNIAHVITISQRQINNLLNKNTPIETKDNLVQIDDNLLLANKMIKIASYELEFSFVFEKNIVDQIWDYINRIRHSHSPIIKFEHSKKNQFKALSDEINENIFSVFQEMLGNAIKYSHAETIRITLLLDDGKIVLQVVDNGIGFDYDEVRHGLGFPNMKKRAEKLNGTFTFESEKGFGAKLKFVV